MSENISNRHISAPSYPLTITLDFQAQPSAKMLLPTIQMSNNMKIIEQTETSAVIEIKSDVTSVPSYSKRLYINKGQMAKVEYRFISQKYFFKRTNIRKYKFKWLERVIRKIGITLFFLFGTLEHDEIVNISGILTANTETHRLSKKAIE